MADQPQSRGALQTLIVEDNELNQRMIKAVLISMGVSSIDLADDGVKGLAKVKAKAQPYDLIISDIEMPNMNGLDFVKAIRKDYMSTTIVMLTAKTDTAEFSKAKFMGVEYFFMKPITPAMLKLRLSAVLNVAAHNKKS